MLNSFHEPLWEAAFAHKQTHCCTHTHIHTEITGISKQHIPGEVKQRLIRLFWAPPHSDVYGKGLESWQVALLLLLVPFPSPDTQISSDTGWHLKHLWQRQHFKCCDSERRDRISVSEVDAGEGGKLVAMQLIYILEGLGKQYLLGFMNKAERKWDYLRCHFVLRGYFTVGRRTPNVPETQVDHQPRLQLHVSRMTNLIVAPFLCTCAAVVRERWAGEVFEIPPQTWAEQNPNHSFWWRRRKKNSPF